ncbi:MAG: 3-methyl-2-oxobutanoate dehydrogenase (2-methylpropanoyl-transferring) subunit alpha, partial [Actinomycetia bacterium]|nr:3-methyl-2-oxobutanoate dehydrogenase (2-methylpropanoyl-transferring) subunit alpha [Actinomycetes bacterium]
MAQMRQMRLTVPEPPARPGEEPDFSHVPIPPAGTVPKLPIDAPPEATHPLTTTIIRVLDDEGTPVGEWVPELADEIKIRALRHLIET